MTHITQRAGKFLKETAPIEEKVNNMADYYLLARASRENYKATFDMLFDDGDLD